MTLSVILAKIIVIQIIPPSNNFTLHYVSIGARVIMACRDMEKAVAALEEVKEGSGNQNVIILKLDLADTKSIKEFAEVINRGTGSVWYDKTH